MTPPEKRPAQPATGFTDAERAAMREAIRERRPRPRAGKPDGERDVLEKISGMDPSDRAMAERVHALIRATAPGLIPRTWYGMPAYGNEEGHVVCFFRDARKFGTRYATLGFSDEANLDEGRMWPTDFALTRLTAEEESRIVELVKRAVSRR
jgi:uncharacterized protein YdhG (YjbR/CyaY superfamily)